MAETSNISWTHHTASPWFGCSKVSPGCQNCYAEKLTLQKGWAGWGDNSPRVRSKGFWNDVYAWDRKAQREGGRRRTFTSLMDFLDPMAPIEWFGDYLETVLKTPHLDHLMLTKRPELYKPRLEELWRHFQPQRAAGWIAESLLKGHPFTNAWIGATVEDQQRADERIPLLEKIPAKLRWLSVEPLLEPIRFRTPSDLLKIRWVVVGGESGPGRRDCGVDAIINVVAQCKEAGVPVWVKQDCAAKPGQQGRIPDDIWAMKELPV